VVTPEVTGADNNGGAVLVLGLYLLRRGVMLAVMLMTFHWPRNLVGNA
jgi:hypothetical protein